eukprot:TRINITY_DN4960_c0_g1_i1.p2 TRINITY_DN4960_c0_g1~~TRINITY_DN4960_c0_g1_i1.p2  ORF type:complete len:179 (-),score=19.93 TRINITY_DN4960_c0_g1_i1:24-560(-)
MERSGEEDWVYSNVKIGDEQRPGVEKSWKSEYAVEFAKSRLEQPSWTDPHHPFFKTPRTVKDCSMYYDHNRQMSLEKKFGQKVKERGSRSVLQLRYQVKLAESPAADFLTMEKFKLLLAMWNIVLDPEDEAMILRRYDTKGDHTVDMKAFLAVALPCDFGPDKLAQNPTMVFGLLQNR